MPEPPKRGSGAQGATGSVVMFQESPSARILHFEEKGGILSPLAPALSANRRDELPAMGSVKRLEAPTEGATKAAAATKAATSKAKPAEVAPTKSAAAPAAAATKP